MPATATPSPAPNSSTTLRQATPRKPTLNMSDSAVNPAQWLNFSMPPRRTVPGSGGAAGIPRRSRKGDAWRGGAMTRERYVHANFRFVLKPTEMLSYGAHFADPDISLHWPHILQILVPTFSAFSVAQGYVSSDPVHRALNDDELGTSMDEDEIDGLGEEAALTRRRMEEERRGRMCPICLGKPVAGRMTKCGHIFCFPCILHFIQLSDIPKSAKCPICGDTVHEGMLKSVKYLDAATMLGAISDAEEAIHHRPSEDDHHGHGMIGEMEGFETAQQEARNVDAFSEGGRTEPEVRGHRIHMRLIQRPQMTTQALPSSPTWPSDAVPPHTAPFHFLPDVLSYSRFMVATPDYMLGELEREQGELKREWEMLRGDDLGREFVRAARDKVERQVGKVKAELMTPFVKKSEEDSRDAWADAVGGELREKEKRRERECKAKERDEAAKREREMVDIPTEFLATQHAAFTPNINVEPHPMPIASPRRARRRNGPSGQVTSTPPSPSYYFYQSSLGASVYLHPLDIRVLLAHFKSYSAFPQTLTFTSSGFDPGTINDELRKRCKYLSHLPAGTEVIFVEAELEDIVGKESLLAFEQPLRARKSKRRERVKREDRAKTRWEKAEREKLPASSMTPGHEDREFALALARSTVEAEEGYNWSAEPALGSSPARFHPGSAGSTTPLATGARTVPVPSPSTSPSTTAIWGSQPQPRASFARALGSSTAAPSRPREQAENDWQVDAAWQAFDRLSLGSTREREGELDDEVTTQGTVKETETGGGKKGRKAKGGKKVLVLGGGGGRRA